MENTSEKTFSLDDYDFENIPSNYFDRLKIAHKYHSTDYIVTRYEQIISKLMYMDIENKSIILAKIKKAFSILSNKLNCMKYLSLLESNDYNSILDISIDDKIDVIRKSYNKLIRTHHPDKYGDKDVSEKIQEAFNVLSDEKKRRNYDKTIKQYYDLKDEKIKYNEQFEQNIMNVTQDMMNDGIEKIKNNDLIDDNIIGRTDDKYGLTKEHIDAAKCDDHEDINERLKRLKNERDNVYLPRNEKIPDGLSFKEEFDKLFHDEIEKNSDYTILHDINDFTNSIVEYDEYQQFQKELDKRLHGNLDEIVKSYINERGCFVEEEKLRLEMEAELGLVNEVKSCDVHDCINELDELDVLDSGIPNYVFNNMEIDGIINDVDDIINVDIDDKIDGNENDNDDKDDDTYIVKPPIVPKRQFVNAKLTDDFDDDIDS